MRIWDDGVEPRVQFASTEQMSLDLCSQNCKYKPQCYTYHREFKAAKERGRGRKPVVKCEGHDTLQDAEFKGGFI